MDLARRLHAPALRVCQDHHHPHGGEPRGALPRRALHRPQALPRASRPGGRPAAHPHPEAARQGLHDHRLRHAPHHGLPRRLRQARRHHPRRARRSGGALPLPRRRLLPRARHDDARPLGRLLRLGLPAHPGLLRLRLGRALRRRARLLPPEVLLPAHGAQRLHLRRHRRGARLRRCARHARGLRDLRLGGLPHRQVRP